MKKEKKMKKRKLEIAKDKKDKKSGGIDEINDAKVFLKNEELLKLKFLVSENGRIESDLRSIQSLIDNRKLMLENLALKVKGIAAEMASAKNDYVAKQSMLKVKRSESRAYHSLIAEKYNKKDKKWGYIPDSGELIEG